MPSEHPEIKAAGPLTGYPISGYRKWVLLSCFLLAAAMLYWSVSHYYEGRLMVRVAIKNIPPPLMVTGRPDPAIEIRVCGPESIIKKLSTLNLIYTIDLSGAKAGSNRVCFERDQFPLPDGIFIKKIYGHEATIFLEKAEIKTLPVHPVHSGKPAFAHEVGTVTAQPNVAVLKGPKKIMDKLSEINTSPVDITGLSESVTRTVSLELPENVMIIRQDTPFTAYIDIHKKIVEKKFQHVKIYGKNATYDCVIRPEKIDITVSGPLLSLSGRNLEKDMDVYVDLDGLKPGIYVKPATIRLPKGISLAVADPKLFTVEIRAHKKGGE